MDSVELLGLGFNLNFNCACRNDTHTLIESRDFVLNYSKFEQEHADQKFYGGPDPEQNLQRIFSVNYKFEYFNLLP